MPRSNFDSRSADASSKGRRAAALTSLVLAGETIYTLPYYLRRDYPTAMRQAFDVNNTTLGSVSSLFGLVAIACYAPGGWLADRANARLLLPLSLAVTGLAGFYLGTFPAYALLLATFALMGVSTILTFWAALIKATRAWGGAEAQGRAFGLLDGGRGLVGAATSSLALALFAWAETPVQGLRWVVLFYAGVVFVVALPARLFVPDTELSRAGADTDVIPSAPSDAPGAARRPRLRDAARYPAVWLLSAIVLCAYIGYWGTFNLAGYAVDGFGRSQVFGARLSTTGVWLRPLSAFGAGLAADRWRPASIIALAFALLIGAFGSLAALAPRPAALWVLWAQATAICAGAYALRGVYFALLEDGGVPAHLTGSAVGVVSVLGYTADFFVPLLAGWLFDRYPGALGYRYLFAFFGACAALGLLATWVLARRSGSHTTTRRNES